MEPEVFEFGLRFMGTEIFGFIFKSQSTRKIWMALVILGLTSFGLFIQMMFPYLSLMLGIKP